ncbi:uncharacterized protein LOC108989115 [Juglans regia]|uniref:Uncharacterized protein LOC108989115 n=1 Tax=Juglans regia TaxID=51240 RepID=A0A6P9EUM2_JUGRE|nr:uncharacterized protein LOC108989115 [Juglans regia]XP_035550907.1 uncharacterized protein LOC108989115 [Juglans regia]
MQVIVNISPNRQEHTNKRDDGHVLPRDHDQEPKKSFVGWDQEYSSSTTIDQGKSNIMGSEMKSMRKPGEESLVVRQEYLSDNVVERDTKPKPVVGNPTGYDYFLSSKRECSTTGVLGEETSTKMICCQQRRKKVAEVLQKMSWTALHGQVLHLKRRRKRPPPFL